MKRKYFDSNLCKRFAVKNSGICCLALKFNLNNPRMKSLQSKNQFKIVKFKELYTFLGFQYNPWLSG